MIQFPCRCSQIVSVPEDQAGLTTQCPRCGRLLDIPNLSELTNIDADGSYKLDQPDSRQPQQALQQLTTVYFPGRVDSHGLEIDLRGPTVPPADAPPPPPAPGGHTRPRYDPESGELIRVFDVQASPDAAGPPPQPLPVAQRVITYHGGEPAAVPERLPGGLRVLLHLLTPTNLIVMGVVCLAHVLLAAFILITLALPFFVLATIALILMLVGHYVVVIEEIGIEERDELPRPLRDLQLYEDIIAPCTKMGLAMLLCYWPLLLTGIANGMAMLRHQPPPFTSPQVNLTIALIGSVLFPAVLLTAATSGTLLNLRPDRVIRTLVQVGPAYLALIPLWIVGALAVGAGQGAVFLLLARMVGARPIDPLTTALALPTLMLGIYLLHAFSWYLGLGYRRGHTMFPWVLQRHLPRNEAVQRPREAPPVQARPPQPPRQGMEPR